MTKFITVGQATLIFSDNMVSQLKFKPYFQPMYHRDLKKA